MPSDLFRYDLLDLADNFLRPLDGVHPEGSLDFSTYATIKGSGNITLTVTEPIDWRVHRVRIWHNGTALITAIPKAPTEKHTATGVEVDLELYDKTLILAEDSFGAPYGLPAGTNVIEAVAAIIGQPLDSDPQTLSTARVWDAGETKLRVVNDLLDAANYFSLTADGMGRFLAIKYTDPAARPVSWAFADDENGLYLPDFTRDCDDFDLPNRYVVVGRSDDDQPGEWREAIDAADIELRDKTITRTEADVEYTNPETLQELANRRLAEARQPYETFEIEHPRLPFGLNDVVTFTNKRTGAPIRAVCTKQSARLVTGGLVESTIRRLA